jgi:CBS domain-containing protein
LQLQSLGIAHGPVVHISTEGTVLEALEKMSKYSVSSIAVVEPTGNIYGNISMADIRVQFLQNNML